MAITISVIIIMNMNIVTHSIAIFGQQSRIYIVKTIIYLSQ